MTFRYVVSSIAVDDLDDIYSYILTYGGPGLVEEVAGLFLSSFETLTADPYAKPVYLFEPPIATPIATRHEYRSVNVYNYKVFYYVDETGGVVVISRVCHKAADFTRRGF